MSTIKVVIAEDDQQIAEIQKRFLERIDNIELVGVAHGLVEAEDVIDVMKPDLLLLDVQFPTGTGLDLLRKIRANNSEVDVILITAAKEVDTLREALRFGVFDYILKPLVFERLQETFQNYQTHRQKLLNLNSLAQQDVDTVIPRNQTITQPAPQETRLPKGIDGLTLDKVKAVFADSTQALSAEEVGDIIGASRTTARRYLEYMVSCHDLSAEVAYGTVGRPERRYMQMG